MIKKNGIRLTRRTKSIKQDSHTPLQRMHGYRCRHLIDGLHTGIKNARCGTIGQNSLSYVDML